MTGTPQQCASAAHVLYRCSDHTSTQVAIVIGVALFALAAALFEALTNKET